MQRKKRKKRKKTDRERQMTLNAKRHRHELRNRRKEYQNPPKSEREFPAPDIDIGALSMLAALAARKTRRRR